jgi:cbb3-type cytochrome oxidase subunit 3
MTKEYKITMRHFLKEWGLNILVVLFILYLLYLSHKPNPDIVDMTNKSKLVPVIYTTFMLVMALIPMIVLLNHYYCDKNTVLIIDTDSSEFLYKNGAYSKSVKINDIKLVKIYYSSIMIRRGFSTRYFEVFLRDNTQILISSLVESSWLEYLGNVRIVQEPKFIMLI